MDQVNEEKNPSGDKSESPLNALLPCPFCGGKAKSSPTCNEDGAGMYIDRWAIHCRACNFEMIEMVDETKPKETPWYRAAEAVLVHKWNTRASAWRPIETAPKMRIVLLWADTSTPEFSNWRMGSGHFHSGIGAWIWEGEQVKEGWAHPPTHWMPLPDPPSDTE